AGASNNFLSGWISFFGGGRDCCGKFGKAYRSIRIGDPNHLFRRSSLPNFGNGGEQAVILRPVVQPQGRREGLATNPEGRPLVRDWRAPSAGARCFSFFVATVGKRSSSGERQDSGHRSEGGAMGDDVVAHNPDLTGNQLMNHPLGPGRNASLRGSGHA